LSIAAFDGGKNLFYDAGNENALSQEAMYFVGGILEHIGAVSLFTNPTINSHRRLMLEPKYSSAGTKDRYNSIVLTPYEANEYTFKAIFPDPLANPYLATAAIFAAGIDGIKKKKEPVILTESPLIMSEAQRKKMGVYELPRSPADSVSNLESDNDFLKGIFSTDIVYAYTEMKLQEYKEAMQKPSAYDYEAYFHM
jgi:glutamine synthetase